MIKAISDLHKMAKRDKPKKLVLAAAHDENALKAAIRSYESGVVDLILVGDKNKIASIGMEHKIDTGGLNIIDEPLQDRAAAISVQMVSEGKADIVMKGNIGTSILLKAVLNKDWGLRSGNLLSHLAIFELNDYHKILGLTDAAMNIAPSLENKISIIENSVNYFRLLGINTPKVALLSAVETVNPGIQSSFEAAVISKMATRNQIQGCIIDGPLAFDNAISSKSAIIKGIESNVAGDADILVGHNIDTTNVLYKSLIYFAHAKCAAVIVGAAAPIVLTSRADSDETKLNSIALAAAVN